MFLRLLLALCAVLAANFAATSAQAPNYCPSDYEHECGSITSGSSGDHHTRLIIIEAHPFTCSGRVKAWRFYRNNNEPFKVGIWRRTYGSNFKLIGENEVPNSGNGEITYEVPTDEQMHFLEGDYISLRWNYYPFNYRTGETVRYLSIGYYDAINPGDEKAISSTDNRIYSIMAIQSMADSPGIVCTEESVGSEVKDRASNGDSTNLLVLLFRNPFECYGQVKGWQFYSINTNKFKVGVWRDWGDGSYQMIGENEITSSLTGRSTIQESQVLTSNSVNWISFQPGDFIGIRWPSSGAALEYDTSGTGTYDVKYIAHNDNDYELNEYSLAESSMSEMDRAYSLTAVISKYEYEGCYPDRAYEREMFTQVGMYDNQLMSVSFCIAQCAIQSKTYAALEEGSLCFCTDKIGTYGAGDQICNMTCSDDSLMCGNQVTGSVFKAPETISGLKLAEMSETETYQSLEITANVTRGIGVSYEFEIGDGTIFDPVTSGTVNHFFSKPGHFAVKVTATDSWGNKDTSVTTVAVRTAITDIRVVCPNAVEWLKIFECSFYVYQGTNATAFVDFGDGTNYTFPVADDESGTFGALPNHNSALSDQPTNVLYLLINKLIHTNGLLVGWEFFAVAKGTILFQIYRPSCSSASEKYCYRSNICIPKELNCESEKNIWAKNCTSGPFSLTQRKCVNTNKDIEPDLVFSEMQYNYEFMIEYEYIITDLGKQFLKITLDDQFEVQAGDVIGWYNSGDGKLGYTVADLNIDGPEFLPSISGFPNRDSSGYIAYSQGSASHDYMHALKAHVVRPSILAIYHNYTMMDDNDNRHNVSLNVSNGISESFHSTIIKVQKAVENFAFEDLEEVYPTFKDYEFELKVHLGTERRYYCDYGDGISDNFTENTFEHAWEIDGVFTVICVAYNDISSQSYEREITIQHKISGLWWDDSIPISPWPEFPITPKELGEESYINFGMSRGTNVTFEISVGDPECPKLVLLWDDELHYIIDDELIPESIVDPNNTLDNVIDYSFDGLKVSLVYRYPESDTYTIVVKGYNLVSKNKYLFTSTEIQIAIRHFKLLPPGPVIYGSYVEVACNISQGSHLRYESSFTLDNDEASITDDDHFYMNTDIGVGWVAIDTDKYFDRGYYTLYVKVYNLVSGIAEYGLVEDSIDVQVEYAVEDLRLWVSRPHIRPDTEINIYFDMFRGSDLHYNLSFGDGKSEYDENEVGMYRNQSDLFKISHSYYQANDYNITLHIWSAVSDVIQYFIVKVQNPVEDIEYRVITPGIIPYQEESFLYFYYNFTGNPDWPPTDADVNYYIENVVESYNMTIERTLPFPNDVIIGREYEHAVPLEEPGRFQVDFNISNLVSYMTFEVTIEMEQPITDFKVASPKPNIPVGDTVTLIPGQVWGSRVSYIWDFKNGVTATFNYNPGDQELSEIYNPYTEEGTYEVQVTAWNLLGTFIFTMTTSPIRVQYPVKHFTLSGKKLNALIVESFFVSVPFTLNWQYGVVHWPTEAQYKILWQDGTSSPITPIHSAPSVPINPAIGKVEIWSNNHQYFGWGNYNVTVEIWNLVSTQSVVLSVWVYETITGLAREVEFNNVLMNPSNLVYGHVKNATEGAGSDTEFLPLEKAIIFSAEMVSGTGLQFEWNFADIHYVAPTDPPPTAGMNDSVSVVASTVISTVVATNVLATGSSISQSTEQPGYIYTTITPYTAWWFTEPGEYWVQVNVSNPVDSEIATKKIIIQRSIMGVQVEDPGPRPRNLSLDYQVHLGSVGSDACYRLNFRDETQLINPIVLAGHLETCSKKYKADMEVSNRRFYPFSTLYLESLLDTEEGPSITVYNTFQKKGCYVLLIDAINMVSEENLEVKTCVTKGWCSYPEVDVNDKNKCDANYPLCDNYGYRSYYKSKDMFVYSKIKVNCTSTKVVMFTWRIWEFKPETQVIGNELFPVDKILTGYTLRELIIDGYLSYGFYLFQLNVSMIGEEGVETTDFTIQSIQKTPLSLKIDGGSEMTIPWNIKQDIDGRTYAIDPDIDSTDKSGMLFFWQCRREHETFAEYNDDFTELVNPGDPGDFIMEENDYGGCFGRYGYDENSIHGGLINVTKGIWIMDTFPMYEKMTYILRLIVIKDTRRAVFDQILEIAEGDPPRLGISCKTNCKDKVNPTSRYALESFILDWRPGMILYYEWSLYMCIINDNGAQEWKKLDSADWTSYAGTGYEDKNMAVDTGLFADETCYKFRLTASRDRYFENSGRCSVEMITNERPVPDRCWVTLLGSSVEATNGTALETKFVLYCSGWFDVDMPFNYRFAIRQKPGASLIWVYSGVNSNTDEDEGFLLSSGFEENNYTVELLARVEDSIGSFTDLSVYLQVYPPIQDGDTLTEKLRNMTILCEEVLFSGDISTGSTLLIAIMLQLNEQYYEDLALSTNAQNATSPSSTLSAELESRSNFRLWAREKLSSALAVSSVFTLGAIKLSCSSFYLLSSIPEENTLIIQSDIMTTSTRYSEVIDSKAKANEASPDEIEDTSVCVISLMDNAGRGATRMIKSAEAQLNSALEEQSAIEDQIATAELEAEGSSMVCIPLEEGGICKTLSEQKIEIVSRVTDYSDQLEENKLQAQTLQESKKNPAEALVQVMKDFMVTGQSPVEVQSETSTGKIDNQNPTKFGERSVNSGGNCDCTITTPAAEEMFEIDNNTLYFVCMFDTQCENPKTWTNESAGVQGSLQGMACFNASNHEIPVTNLKIPIVIWLTRTEDQASSGEVVWRAKTTQPGERMFLHKIVLEAPYPSAQMITVKPLDWNGTDTDNVTFTLYFAIGRKPGIEDYDFNCTLPHPIEYIYDVNGTATIDENQPDRHTCFFDNVFLREYTNGTSAELIFGIKSSGGFNESLIEAEEDANEKLALQSFWAVDYEVNAFATSCEFWLEAEGKFSRKGTMVGRHSNKLITECIVYHLTEFGGGATVPMNSIDLGNSAFTQLAENPVVFAFMTGCIGLYCVIIIWARKADQRDIVMAGITPLPDNDPRDHFNYEVTFFTGVRKNADTTAKVSIIMSGEEDETPPRLIKDDKRKIFDRGGIDTFLMACPMSLGNITLVRVWHDNSGKRPQWFLNRISIKDLQTNKIYYFMLDQWLAVEEDDGQIERVIPVAGKSELTSFGHLFYSKTRRNLSDGHLWFSVFTRPARSSFTRVQRATCCLSLLFSTMMANILFYGVDITSGGAGGSLKVGDFFSISLAEITIGVISSLMIFPSNLLVVQIFRNARDPPPDAKFPCNCKSKTSEESTSITTISKEVMEKDKKDHLDARAQSELEHQLHLLETGGEEEDDAMKSSRSRKSSTNLDSSRGIKRSPSRISALSEEEEESDSEYEYETESEESDEYYNDSEPELEDRKIKFKDDETGEVGEEKEEDMELVAGFKKTKKKPDKPLPWYFLYVGWFVAFCTVTSAFYVTIEIAGTFGKEKATEWLKSMCISSFQDILISQPIKVLCLATFYALVIKNPDKEDEPMSPHLKPDEEWLHARMREDELQDPEKMKRLQEIKEKNSAINPPDLDELQEARELRFKEIEMSKILREIWIYVIFLTVLMLVGYGARDPRAYYVQTSVKGVFAHASENGIHGIDTATSREKFWTYVDDVFVPSLYSGAYYNGYEDKLLMDENYIADKSAVLVRSARLRQLRVEQENCSISDVMSVVISKCRSEYSVLNSDNQDFEPGWILANISNMPDYNDPEMKVWQFQDFMVSDSYPTFGRVYNYPGGGYIVEFDGQDKESSVAMVSYLKDNFWVDQYTRVVFFEFAVYHPTANVFSVSQSYVEFIPQGGAIPVGKFHTLTLDRYTGGFAYMVLAGECVFVGFIIYFAVGIFRKIKVEKKKYFSDPWNWAEFITVGMAIGAITSYAYRILVGKLTVNDLTDITTPDVFISFQYLVYWDDIYVMMLGIMIYIADIKALRLLRFNKKIRILEETISHFAPEIFLFLIMFFTVFTAFSCFAYLIFGQNLYDYVTFLSTIESLFATLLGKFDFQAMLQAQRIFGPIFFFLYVLTIMFMLLNMFVTIISLAFTDVKVEFESIDNEYEIIDFMMDRFKKWTGISEPRIKRVNAFQYIEGKEEIQIQCDEMGYKLEVMVERLNEYVKKEKEDDKELYEDDFDADAPRRIFIAE